ncbi:MAG: NUDIX domain-containing protein [Patescibacteria group bacterium]
MNKKNKIYIGIYGIFIKDGNILVINKSRGPYMGKYDLPGGGLDFDETTEQCLEREIDEETGAKILNKEFFCYNEYRCQYRENGEYKNFHHLALYYIVDLDVANIKKRGDGQDSLGAESIPLSNLSALNTSPIAYPIILRSVNKITQK